MPRGARLITLSGNVLGSQTRGIELRHAERVAITGNTIYDSAEWSLLAAHCSGIAVGANTLGWRGDADAPSRDGIRLEDCENCALTGLVAQRLSAGSAASGAGVTLVRCRDSSIAQCQILDPLHRGIELEDCVRCRVSDNTVVDRRRSPSMRHAIRVRGTAEHILVQNNLVGGAQERAIVVPDGAVIQGNVETSP